MKKQTKPGDLFNKFQTKKAKHKKSYSESDMGSMKGYNPNLGVSKGAMRAMAKPAKQTIQSAVKSIVRPSPAQGATTPSNFPAGKANANSTKMMAKKKHSKKHKNMTLAQDAAYNKKHGVKDKKHKKAMKCKTCGR